VDAFYRRKSAIGKLILSHRAVYLRPCGHFVTRHALYCLYRYVFVSLCGPC